MQEQMIPIQFAKQWIEQYIYLTKGVQISIKLPIQPSDEEKFIQALNIAMFHLNVDVV